MAKKITLKQMRYFVSAARTGRFSMAAVQEHVSQSAITNAVADLEQQLGVSLFERLQHGVNLTEAGRVFFRHACFILESVDEAMSISSQQAITGVEGRLKVAASYTMIGYFLPELVARFKRANPNVFFDLMDLNLKDMQQAVRAGEIDLAAGLLSNIQDRTEYHHVTLLRSPRRLWVSPTHPLGQLTSINLAQIAPYPYIMVTVDDAEGFTDKFWQDNDLNPNYVLKTGSLESVRGFVGQGLGVTILSDMVYRPWSLDGKKINAIPIEGGVPDLEAGLFWAKGQPLNKVADAFQRFLVYACVK